MSVWRTHHRNLAAHAIQPGHPICPVAIYRGATLKLQAVLFKESDGGIQVGYCNANVVHAPDGHADP